MIRPDAFLLPQAVQGIEMDGSPFIEPYSWRGSSLSDDIPLVIKHSLLENPSFSDKFTDINL